MKTLNFQGGMAYERVQLVSGAGLGAMACGAVEGIRRYTGPCPGDALVRVKAATEVPGQRLSWGACG